MKEAVYERKVTQVTVNRVTLLDGKPIGACQTVLRECCPPRISSESGLSIEELIEIKEENWDLCHVFWEKARDEDEFGFDPGPAV